VFYRLTINPNGWLSHDQPKKINFPFVFNEIIFQKSPQLQCFIVSQSTQMVGFHMTKQKKINFPFVLTNNIFRRKIFSTKSFLKKKYFPKNIFQRLASTEN